MTTLLVIAAVIAVAVLGWYFYRQLTTDHLAALTERRRANSRMVGRGEFVDGNRHLPVALAVDDATFFYENPDMQASLDLQFVREVEYDDELATGAPIHGAKVLRLRSNSQTFEFVVPNDIAPRWQSVLPARNGPVSA